jgi:hypothetical protein
MLISWGGPASAGEISAAELRAGVVRFASDFPSRMAQRNGVEGWFGGVYLMLDSATASSP